MKQPLFPTTKKTLHCFLPAAMACLSFIAVSHADGIAGQWKAGVKTVYFESPGTKHAWHTWRRSLHDFAPRLFHP